MASRPSGRCWSGPAHPSDPDAYLDKRRWWSYDTKISLFAAAADVLGDDDVGLRVAEAVLEHSVGAAERLALSLTGGPGRLLRMVAKAGAKFSTVSDLRALRVTASRRPSSTGCTTGTGPAASTATTR